MKGSRSNSIFPVITTFPAGGGFTVTVAVWGADEPPTPVHVSVKLEVWMRGRLSSVPPAIAFAPDQSPEAVQLVAFAAVHVSVAACAAATVVGLAVKVTVGGGTTVTVTDCALVPPVPVQDNVNIVVAVRTSDCWLPLVSFVPLHPWDAVQLVAFVLLQLRVVDCPEPIEAGFAVIVTEG